MRITGSSCRPHQHPTKPCTTSHLYRHMKFLPKPKTETPLERYTGVGTLETYIEHTKQELADNLPQICRQEPSNLTPSQQTSLTKLQHARDTLTIKPADKNLGIVLMNTEDYIAQCLLHLSDNTTYRPAKEYPTEGIRIKIQNLTTTAKDQLNKHLYRFLNEGPPHPQIPQLYGIPKIHKKYINLPPMRPIISQSSSLLSPSAQFIDHVLQPLAMSYPDYIQNSTALTLHLQDTTVPDDAILVTVDVANLYPSIPQSECLSIIHTIRSGRYNLLIEPLLLICNNSTSSVDMSMNNNMQCWHWHPFTQGAMPICKENGEVVEFRAQDFQEPQLAHWLQNAHPFTSNSRCSQPLPLHPPV